MNPNNIVYVNFKSKAVLDTDSCFLEICRSELSEEDFYDLLEAIVNPSIYSDSDEDIQDLVDFYYEH